MGILRAAAFPAVLTLLLTGVGWLFDRSVARFESVLFLNYSAQAVTTEGATRYTISIENQSAAGTFTEITVLVRCPLDRSCLKERTNADENNRHVMYEPVPPITISWKPNDDTRNVFSQFEIEFLPVGGKARFAYDLIPGAAAPEVWFQFPKMTDKNISVFSGFSAAAWFAANYYIWLFWTMIALILGIAAYFIWLGLAREKGGNNDEAPKTFHLVHRLGDRPGTSASTAHPMG